LSPEIFISLSDKGEFDRTKREAEVEKTVQEMAGDELQ
jgi:hypothetical protein